MKEFTEALKLDNICIPLADLALLEPTTAQRLDKHYLLNNSAAKVLAKLRGMPSLQFSKTLFKLDPAAWLEISKNLAAKDYVIDQLRDNQAVVIGSTISTIASNYFNLSKVLEVINKFVSNDNYKSFIQLSNSNLISILIYSNSNSCGLIINYYIDSHWIDIINAKLMKSHLILATTKEYSSEIDNPELDLEGIERGSLMRSSAELMEYVADEYESTLESNLVSTNELVSIFKRYLGIKLPYSQEEAFDQFLNLDVDSSTAELAQAIFSSIYNDSNVVGYLRGNYLQKATRMSKINYYQMSTLMYQFVKSDHISIADYANFITNVLAGNNDYAQLNATI